MAREEGGDVAVRAEAEGDAVELGVAQVRILRVGGMMHQGGWSAASHPEEKRRTRGRMDSGRERRRRS